MLARAGFSDDARFAHALGEKRLANAVVDLMRAGVVQILALEIHLGAAPCAGQPFGEVERAWPADVMGEIARHGDGERRIAPRVGVSSLEFKQKRHQRFGDITPAEQAEVAVFVGSGAERVQSWHRQTSQQADLRRSTPANRGASAAIAGAS